MPDSRLRRLKLWATALCCVASAAADSGPRARLEFSASAKEPYPPLAGGAFTGPAVAASPDPLVRYRWRTVRAGDGLQIYTLRPQRFSTATPASFENLSSAVGAEPRITVRAPGSIRFDFGVESAAWLEFDSPDLAGEVEMSISEYNQPAIVNKGPRHPVKTTAPVRHGNTYRLELNRDLYEGVRFGWIHVRRVDRPWHITAVRLVCQTKPANYQGAFASNDALLDRIWYTGAYAVKLNLLTDYFGAILMDRGDRISWTGDAHPSQAAALAAFGNWDFVKANLERTAHADNTIESYSLYWVLSLVDYYRYTGDNAALDTLAPVAMKKLAHAEAIWSDPPMNFYGWDERTGAGFEKPNNPESKLAYRLLAIRACRELAWALAARGDAKQAGEIDAAAARLTRRLENSASWWRKAGLHVAAEAVAAGLAGDTRPLWSREFADPLNRLSYSPFNQCFVLQAMASVGMHEEALATVRDLWGAQLQYGGTCFFEVFRPSWNLFLKPNDPVPNCQAGYTSLCHPWSSGVTKWLSEETLGIRPLTPGFATFSVVPHLGGTLTRVAGVMPTPRGPIAVDVDTARGYMTVTAPAGTEGTIGIPKQSRTIRAITSNGTLIWDGAFHKAPGIAAAREDAGFVYFNGVQPGRHTFQIRYDAPPVALPARPNPVSYPAKRVEAEPRGADGWVRFSIGESGSDVSHLPDYVAAVTHVNARAGVWPSLSTATGYLMTGNPSATKQTMTVDVRLKSEHGYRMALHLIDGDRQQRRMAVELFDLDTLKLIAPVALVEDFAGGKYLVYEYDRSCRVRLSHVTGGDAVISGIYFDPRPRSF